MNDIIKIIFGISVLLIITSGCSNSIYRYSYTISGEKIEKIDIEELKKLKSTKTDSVEIVISQNTQDLLIEIFNKHNLTRTEFTDILDKTKLRRSILSYKHYHDVPGIGVENTWYDNKGYPLAVEYYFWPTKSNNLENLKTAATGGIPIGTWQKTETDSGMLNTIDYERGFSFTLKEVLAILSSREIDLEKNRVSIEKDINNIRWSIKYDDFQRSNSHRISIQIDANKGKILSEHKIPIAHP